MRLFLIIVAAILSAFLVIDAVQTESKRQHISKLCNDPTFPILAKQHLCK